MSNDARDTLAVIPWYWRDWRASKARAVLISDPVALLAYRELLDALWGEPDCCLPDDDESLAALSGLTPEAWAKVKERVLRFFQVGDSGRRSHPRARFEWKKAIAYRESCRTGGINRAESLTPERRSEIAKKAAYARWMPARQEGDACSMLANAYTPSPSPSPTQNQDMSVGPDRAPSPKPLPPIAEVWNRVMTGSPLPVVRAWSEDRQKAWRRASAVEADVAVWERAFVALRESKHHRGENDRHWVAPIDFIFQSGQLAKWVDAAKAAPDDGQRVDDESWDSRDKRMRLARLRAAGSLTDRDAGMLKSLEAWEAANPPHRNGKVAM